MTASGTSVAVGCAVGIPCFFALLVAFTFYVKTKRRFKQEDLDYERNKEMHSVNQDLSYDNLDELKIKNKNTTIVDSPIGSTTDPSETSDDGRTRSENRQATKYEEDDQPSSDNRGKNKRYVPAYRQKIRASVNQNNSRNSSYSNLNTLNTPPIQGGSNSSINSTNTSKTDNFYGNVPVIDDNANQTSSSKNSIDLARSLQQPTPSYSRKSSKTFQNHEKIESPGILSSNQDDENDKNYDLKNNYDQSKEYEIQEEDQYENEFTNYSENKRTYIESLRPKAN